MGYAEALECAGAKVISFKEFGSYQGEWYALVEYKGVVGWVSGWYGSCSGCDAFEGEFGYSMRGCTDHYFYGEDSVSCEGCKAIKADYDVRLFAFGERYLDEIYTHDEAVAGAARNIAWDLSASEMVDYLNDEWKKHNG